MARTLLIQVLLTQGRMAEAREAGFLLQVPENARTLALARQRWGDLAGLVP